MKIKLFLISALILGSIFASVRDGLCQFDQAYAAVMNTKGHPILGSGTFLVLNLTNYSYSIREAMNGLKKITAENTNPGIDDNTYEFSLTPKTYNLGCEWNTQEEFTGQYGIYRFTIEKSSGSNTLDTPPLPRGLTPLPIPENLQVSFERGNTTPTLSVAPVSSQVDFTFYDFRIYDKDYTRRIYVTHINKGDTPIVTFPDNRIWGQTGEDLVPGKRYLFRAEIWKVYPGTVIPMLIGNNFKSFKVPKK